MMMMMMMNEKKIEGFAHKLSYIEKDLTLTKYFIYKNP